MLPIQGRDNNYHQPHYIRVKSRYLDSDFTGSTKYTAGSSAAMS